MREVVQSANTNFDGLISYAIFNRLTLSIGHAFKEYPASPEKQEALVLAERRTELIDSYYQKQIGMDYHLPRLKPINYKGMDFEMGSLNFLRRVKNTDSLVDLVLENKKLLLPNVRAHHAFLAQQSLMGGIAFLILVMVIISIYLNSRSHNAKLLSSQIVGLIQPRDLIKKILLVLAIVALTFLFSRYILSYGVLSYEARLQFFNQCTHSFHPFLFLIALLLWLPCILSEFVNPIGNTPSPYKWWSVALSLIGLLTVCLIIKDGERNMIVNYIHWWSLGFLALGLFLKTLPLFKRNKRSKLRRAVKARMMIPYLALSVALLGILMVVFAAEERMWLAGNKMNELRYGENNFLADEITQFMKSEISTMIGD